MVTNSQHTTQTEHVQEQDTKVDTWREEVTGDWEKLQHKKLHNLYSSSNIIWLTKSRRMRLVGGSKRNKRNAYRMLVGKTKGKRPPVDLGVDEKIIFKQISQK